MYNQVFGATPGRNQVLKWRRLRTPEQPSRLQPTPLQTFTWQPTQKIDRINFLLICSARVTNCYAKAVPFGSTGS